MQSGKIQYSAASKRSKMAPCTYMPGNPACTMPGNPASKHCSTVVITPSFRIGGFELDLPATTCLSHVLSKTHPLILHCYIVVMRPSLTIEGSHFNFTCLKEWLKILLIFCPVVAQRVWPYLGNKGLSLAVAAHHRILVVKKHH